ncbi:MAG: dihydroxyacetone kinase subunit DhaL [Methylomonas sp.]
MTVTPAIFPALIERVCATIASHADTIIELDQAIGDGDHLFNLQRGLRQLQAHGAEIALLDWPEAWRKIGMSIMTEVGGASGSLYATLFLALHKHSGGLAPDLKNFAVIFAQAVAAVKQRGKADVGEKTLLDVLAPVADALRRETEAGVELPLILEHIRRVAADGAEATRAMLATKGRASFLGERSRGHIDAGAKTAELMISAVAEVLQASLPATGYTETKTNPAPW